MGPSIDPWGNTWNDISKVTLSTIYFDTLFPVIQIWVDVDYSISTETICIKFKSWVIQSKASDKSVKTAATTLLLPNLFLQSSKSLIRTCSVHGNLRFAEMNGEKWCSILLIKSPL